MNPDAPPPWRYNFSRLVPDRVLSRPAIIEALKDSQILLTPMDERCIKGSSVDVRLGDWYYAEQDTKHRFSLRWETELKGSCSLVGLKVHEPIVKFTGVDMPKQYESVPMLNPYDPASVKSMWGEPKQAQPLDYDLPGIPKGTPVIVMPPKSVFLAHTHEFIGSLHPEITFMVKARSSIGRNRVRICACAGWGDQGYASRITLELANDSEYRHVVLVPGRRIGQVVFIPTTPLPVEEMYKGKYQPKDSFGKSFAELLADWKPENMLPRMHEDWELE